MSERWSMSAPKVPLKLSQESRGPVARHAAGQPLHPLARVDVEERLRIEIGVEVAAAQRIGAAAQARVLRREPARSAVRRLAEQRAGDDTEGIVVVLRTTQIAVGVADAHVRVEVSRQLPSQVGADVQALQAVQRDDVLLLLVLTGEEVRRDVGSAAGAEAGDATVAVVDHARRLEREIRDRRVHADAPVAAVETRAIRLQFVTSAPAGVFPKER